MEENGRATEETSAMLSFIDELRHRESDFEDLCAGKEGLTSHVGGDRSIEWLVALGGGHICE